MRTLSLTLGCLVLSSVCVAQSASWIQVTTKNTPGPRWAHGNAHDFLRGRTIVFGGGNNNIKGDDTWEYDGKDWAKMNPSTKPSGRRLTAMVFHLAIVKTVMFGGSGVSTSYLNDTWTWDGKTWTQLKPTNSPTGRWGHGMAYDSARQRTVLVGGLGGGLLNDTWEFDGKNWTQIKTQTSPPAGIFGGSIAYDSARKVVVYFGGRTGSNYLNDTWEYDGKDWSKANPTQRPSGRYYIAMAYDLSRQRIVMFGGLGPNGLIGETWEYDGKTWTQIKTAASPPARRDYDEMVYDVARKRIIVYGGIGTSGRLGDTWEYTGSQSLTGTPATISIATGGKHSFTLDAGTANANRLYWVFGSITGTTPGITLFSGVGAVNIPLNPDLYTDITIGLANSSLLMNTRGTLDSAGKGSAALNVPQINDQNAIGFKLYHAYLVYDAQNNFHMASNPVTLTLVK